MRRDATRTNQPTGLSGLPSVAHWVAAAIMIVVFASFILGGERIIKEFGLGLAAAILVDAVVIRSALVPSLMLLFGKANWWFPKWLDRILPHVHTEPEDLDTIEEPELEGAGAP